MAFKVNFNYPKYDDFGKLTGAFIGISDPDTGDNLSANVLGDYRTVGTSEAIAAVLDNFYKRNFADKAMAESVVKIDELEQATKEFKTMVAEMRTAIDESKEQTEQNRELVKTVSLTLNEVLASLYANEEELTDEETTEDTY